MKEIKRQEIYIPPQKRQQIMDGLRYRCFRYSIKME